MKHAGNTGNKQDVHAEIQVGKGEMGLYFFDDAETGHQNQQSAEK